MDAQVVESCFAIPGYPTSETFGFPYRRMEESNLVHLKFSTVRKLEKLFTIDQRFRLRQRELTLHLQPREARLRFTGRERREVKATSLVAPPDL